MTRTRAAAGPPRRRGCKSPEEASPILVDKIDVRWWWDLDSGTAVLSCPTTSGCRAPRRAPVGYSSPLLKPFNHRVLLLLTNHSRHAAGEDSQRLPHPARQGRCWSRRPLKRDRLQIDEVQRRDAETLELLLHEGRLFTNGWRALLIHRVGHEDVLFNRD